jgi:hypothetical protein
MEGSSVDYTVAVQSETISSLALWNGHAERGEMSVRDLALQIAGHDLNHVEQIRKILEQ